MLTIDQTRVVYKTVGDIQLKLHLFTSNAASKANPQQAKAAIIFFHGGRFIQGHPAQFFPHCRYLASRGIVAASAQYRLLGKNASSVLDALADGRSAIRWLRVHALELAIDPAKIVAAGGSAGANISANAAMMQGGDEVGEDTGVSAKPDALILFSPAIIRPQRDEDLIHEQLYASLLASSQIPPMLLLHGNIDEIFPAERMKIFSEQVTEAGNLCELHLYEGGKHGFFNYGNLENRPFFETLLATDLFLRKLELLSGEPTLTQCEIAALRHEGDWQA